jgi:hypothetical protein
MKVAALYVATNGCYFNLPGVDPWDEPRDARKFWGPGPVVAHPPCERWGRYSEGGPSHHGRFKTGDDGGAFAHALGALFKFGGVLEHPKDSKAWDAFQIVKPHRSGGWAMDSRANVWVCCVEQGHYGHRARKPTWLIYHSPVGVRPPDLIWGESQMMLPPQTEDSLARRGRGAYTVNNAIERMCKRERLATPILFRDLLLQLARLSVGFQETK